MGAFIEKHWLTILSLLVATLGGVPGIIAVISHFKSSAKLSVRPANFILGNVQFAPDPTEYTLVFFSLTVSNEGEKVLSPAVFDLYVRIKRRWVKLQRRLIPENINFLSQEQKIGMKEPWKRDLQRYPGMITQGMPLTGFLLFVTNQISLEKLRAMESIKFRFDCVDIFNKRHKEIFAHKGRQIKKDTMYPKHHMSISMSKDA